MKRLSDHGEVVDLNEFRLRGFSDRQRMALAAIEAGEAACGLCGDHGAYSETTNEAVPCMACGRRWIA